MSGFDPQIIQDFLTESVELIEQLDRELVFLEQTPEDPELINRAFRALHTIKGSASFLTLPELVAIAHAAEEALGAVRSGQAALDRKLMDGLLAASDAIRRQLGDLGAGRALTPADEALIAALAAAGPTKVAAPAAPMARMVAPATAVDEVKRPGGPSRTPLNLPENKASLVEFLIQDLRETLALAEKATAGLTGVTTAKASWGALAEQAAMLCQTAAFFDFPAMRRVSEAMLKAARAGAGAESAARVKACVFRMIVLVQEQTEGLAGGEMIDRPCDALFAELSELLGKTQAVEAPSPAPESAVIAASERAVATMPEPEAPAAPPVVEFVETSSLSALEARAEAESAQAAEVPQADDPATTPPVPDVAMSEPPAAPTIVSAPITTAVRDEQPTERARSVPAAVPATEPTIRVRTERLEELLNLVGELVLQKNRMSAMARQAASRGAGAQAFCESFADAAGSLDRVTGDLQAAVMRTRMQRLDKLFGKYSRLVRDLARKTGKDLRLVVEGGQTEVDRSIIEELSDPLVHILRNSADHGLESSEERIASGKPACGTITIAASHRGGSVEIAISDDGRGLSRSKIGRKAVERGLVTEQELARRSDHEVQSLIFAPGFSTAEKVTDLSGRGVGMDVVKTNIQKLRGTIDVASVEGRGTTITIRIPLTVAILTAMMCQIGTETYAIPLSSADAVLRPAPGEMEMMHGLPVLRLSDRVVPLIDGCEVFGLPEGRRRGTPYVVVLALGESRVGLMVSRLLGRQEIVVKPLNASQDPEGPVAGATVREDGGVSLIVDVARTMAIGERQFTERMVSHNAACQLAA